MTDDTMAEAALPEETATDVGESHGTKRSAEDDLDDSTVITGPAARLLGAGSLGAVAEPTHFRSVAGAFGLSTGIASDLHAVWSFCNETKQVSARDELAHILSYLAIFSPMTSTVETLHRVALGTRRSGSVCCAMPGTIFNAFLRM